MNRIGIIDWGIGGISIARLIKEQLGDIPITYFSDTGVTPYGKMERRELARRLDDVIWFLKTNGVTHVVIGCNAASTALADLTDSGVKVEGVIKTAVAATVKLKPTSLGLIGGRRTVLSGIYRRAFAAHRITVRQRIAQPLSGLIESGDVASHDLRAQCKRILSPLKNSSHILLACTHYPAIVPVMRDFVSAKTIFVDPAPSLVEKLRKWQLTGDGEDVYLTTGDPRGMKGAALKAFGWQIAEAARVDL